MKTIKSIVFLVSILTLGFTTVVNGQVAEDSELFKTLKANDSLLFNEGFNKCNISMFEKLVANDFEFYHDNSGISDSKEAFIAAMKNGLCSLNNNVKSSRALVEKSVVVFPLYDNGKLYGAIQKGEHTFSELTKNGSIEKGSLAKFTHLWIKENGSWKIKRVLSYDHKSQLKNDDTITVSETILKHYVGAYNAKSKGEVTIRLKGTNLEIITNEKQVTLYPKSETIFFIKEAPVTFEFVKDSKGEITKFLVKKDDKTIDEAIRVIK